MKIVKVVDNTGLGSLLVQAMGHLLKTDEPAYVYLNSTAYCTGQNMFEWFYHQQSINVDAVPRLPHDNTSYPCNQQLGLDLTRLAKLKAAYARHFKIKRTFTAAAERTISKPTLGIHYRGTDKKREVPRRSYQEVLDLCPKYERVFLATDEVAAMKFFQERIPGLITLPCSRSTNHQGIHELFARQGGLAEEAMADMTCLSRCETLVIGRGNFSDWALISAPQEQRVIYYN